jgi:hypothetical protein
MSSTIRFLMCSPDHYDVDYVINPWMEGNVHKSSRDRAIEQWNRLFHIIKEHATVDLVKPQIGVPDMVFTANAGLVLGDNVVLSRFFHKERQKNLSSNSGSRSRASRSTNCPRTCRLKVRGMRCLTGKDAGCGRVMGFAQNWKPIP